MKKRYWFKAKCFGWGWYPATIEGWAIITVWTIFFTFSMIMLDHEWVKNVIAMTIFTGVLIYICYKTGEKPHRSWGKKN